MNQIVNQKNTPVITPEQAALADVLSSCEDFWGHWGFRPWKRFTMQGVVRQQRLVKRTMFGKIAEIQSWDYIIWQAGTNQERKDFWTDLRPATDVSNQRYLFLLPEPWKRRRVKAFLWGALGFAEFHAFWPYHHPGLDYAEYMATTGNPQKDKKQVKKDKNTARDLTDIVRMIFHTAKSRDEALHDVIRKTTQNP